MISNAAIKRREEKLISDWADGWEQREQAARLLRLEKRRDMVRHHAAARRAAKIQRTPAWVDYEAIKEIYRRVRVVSYETKIPHVVDHIYPLQGALVSGLHVAQNLQIISATENNLKYNHFDIDSDVFQSSDSRSKNQNGLQP